MSNQIRKASQLQNEYDVEGVPSLGVAGRYYTDGTKAGNMENVLRVVNALVASSRKACAFLSREIAKPAAVRAFLWAISEVLTRTV